MKFILNLTVDNAAFHDEGCDGQEDFADRLRGGLCQCAATGSELARILRDTANRLERDGISGFFETLYDANGNDVGRFALKPDSYR